MARKYEQISGQGTLVGETSGDLDSTPSLADADMLTIEAPKVDTDSTEIGVAIDVGLRKEQLLKSIGFLANLSRTSQYETIDENIWFQNTIARKHPRDYQYHVDEVLANRDRFKYLSRAAFDKAFGVNDMIVGGLLSEQEARTMADDFYNGTNKSGYNIDENGESRSFIGSFADSKNQKKREKYRKQLG